MTEARVLEVLSGRPDRICDIAIVGAGLIGSLVAADIARQDASVRVLCIDVCEWPLTEGEDDGFTARASIFESHAWMLKPLSVLSAGVPESTEALPAAAVGAFWGGMGSAWTGSCPSPLDSCRPRGLPIGAWSVEVDRARRYLRVSTPSLARQAPPHLKRYVAELPLSRLASDRPVRSIDLLAEGAARGRVAVSAATQCVEILLGSDGQARGVRVQMDDGWCGIVRAHSILLACDVFRNAQLLHASGLGPESGVWYVQDPLLYWQNVTLERPDRGNSPSASPTAGRLAAYQVLPKYSQHGHGQVMADLRTGRATLAWFLPAPDGGISMTFSSSETDAYGMPALRLHAASSVTTHPPAADVVDEMRLLSALLGRAKDSGEPRALARGASMHAMGTTPESLVPERGAVDGSGGVHFAPGVFAVGNSVLSSTGGRNPTLAAATRALVSSRAALAHSRGRG